MADPLPRLVLCGGAALPAGDPFARRADTRRLRIGRGGGDVHLSLSRLAALLHGTVDPVSADLLEVAAYVYAADQSFARGGTRQFEYGERWRRELRLVVPVRRPDVWEAARDGLEDTLSFVADDEYRFRFVPAADPPDPVRYLTDAVDPADRPPPEFDEVVLFSGGLDSLCGAVEAALVRRRPVVLVSHRAEGRAAARQADLAGELGRRADPAARPWAVGVAVNKGERLTRDVAQRARSFLFAAAAAAVARHLGLRAVTFHENGVTSFNLPLAADAAGGRASRTTHPRTLAGFGRLFAALFGHPFAVRNPALWRTKTDLLAALHAHGHAALAARTVSCAHVRGRPADRPQCGACSQCIDRRLAAVAAGLDDDHDPPGRYASDPALAARDGAWRTLAERYVGAALDLGGVATPAAFAVRYPEVARAVGHAGVPADEAAARAFDLHRRHAAQVRRALTELTRRHADRVIARTVPPDSLLGMAVGRHPASPVAADPTGPGPVVDPSRFAVRWGPAVVELGNTVEYRLATALLAARGRYLSVAELTHRVWDDAAVTANAVQRRVSNLRRKFAEAFGARLVIDGSQPGHYRLDARPPAATTGDPPSGRRRKSQR